MSDRYIEIFNQSHYDLIFLDFSEKQIVSEASKRIILPFGAEPDYFLVTCINNMGYALRFSNCKTIDTFRFYLSKLKPISF